MTAGESGFERLIGAADAHAPHVKIRLPGERRTIRVPEGVSLTPRETLAARVDRALRAAYLFDLHLLPEIDRGWRVIACAIEVFGYPPSRA